MKTTNRTHIATATYLYADDSPLTVAVRVTSRAKTQAGIARAVAARLAKTSAALCGLRLDRVEVAS